MSQSSTQNIYIKRAPLGAISICVPMYAAVQCKIRVQNRGTKTAISWPEGGWITVWSSGVQIRQPQLKLETTYIFPKDARLYCSETLLDITKGQKIALKSDTCSDKESKSPTTSNFHKCLCPPSIAGFRHVPEANDAGPW